MATVSQVNEAIFRSKFEDGMSAGADAAARAMQGLGAAVTTTDERVSRAPKSATALGAAYTEAGAKAAALSRITAKYGADLAAVETQEKAGTLSAQQAAQIRSGIEAKRAMDLARLEARLRAQAAAARDLDASYATLTKGNIAFAAANDRSIGPTMVAARGMDSISNSGRLAAHQVTNLSFQVQDLAVQLASGQSPFVALAQQGPQAVMAVGGLTAAVGLVTGAVAALGNAVRANPIVAAAAAATAVVGAYAALRKSTDDAKIANDAYGAALAATIPITDSAAAAAGRLAAARRAEATFDVSAGLQQQADNATQIAKRRDEILEKIAVFRGLPEGSGAAVAALPNLVLELHGLDVQMRDVTLRQAALQASTEALSPAYAGLQAQLATTAKGLIALEDGMEAARKGDPAGDLERRADILAALDGPMSAYGAKLRELTLAHQIGDISAAEFGRSVANLNTWLYATSDAYARTRDEVAKTAAGFIALEDALEAAHKPDFAAEQKKRSDLYEASKSVVAGLRSATEVYGAEVERLDGMLAHGFLTNEQYARSVENLKNWVQEVDPEFQAAAAAARKFAEETERAIERSADRITDFAADALFDHLEGKSADLWSTFETMGKRAIAQVVAEALIRPIAIQIATAPVGAPMQFIPDDEARQ